MTELSLTRTITCDPLRDAHAREHSGGEKIAARLLGELPGADDRNEWFRNRRGGFLGPPPAGRRPFPQRRPLPGRQRARRWRFQPIYAGRSVVDIINARLLIFASGGFRPADWISEQPYRFEPLVQSLSNVANKLHRPPWHFCPACPSGHVPGHDGRPDVDDVVPGGEKHQHRHDRKPNPETDFLGPIAQRPAAGPPRWRRRADAPVEERDWERLISPIETDSTAMSPISPADRRDWRPGLRPARFEWVRRG